MREITPEILDRVRSSLANSDLCSKEDFIELLSIVFKDYETLLSVGRAQKESECCPPLEDKPNPLDLAIGFSFHRGKQGYSSPCGEFDLNKFGNRWSLKELSSGEEQSFLSKKEATNRVRLHHSAAVLDQMWDLGYEIKKEGLSKEQALTSLRTLGNTILADRNLRIQDDSLDRVAVYIANLFCV